MSNRKETRDEAHAVGDGWGFWLLDKNMEPIGDLSGAREIELTEAVNETTTCSLTFDAADPAVSLFLPLGEIDPTNPELTWRKLVDEAQWIMAEGPGGYTERLVYRVHRITDHVGTNATVTVEGKSLYRYVEGIACRADPNMPLFAQLSYRDFRAGDSLRVMKEYLMVNLMREFQPRAVTGWNLWTGWGNLNPNLWPAIVSPIHESTSTQHTVLDARFDMATDLFSETLDAAGLLMTVDLWLEGDPQPAPSHVHLSMPTFWIDIKTRQFDTSTTGDVRDLLQGLVRSFSQENNSPYLGLGDVPSTYSGRLPWVVWRPDDMKQITSDFTVVKSEFAHVTVGGRSPEVVNKLLGAGSKALFQGLAMALATAIPVFGPLIAAAGVFLGEVVGASMQDKLFAWAEFENSVRKAAHGRFAYRDQVGSGDGWTLSSVQQGFQMLQQGAGMISIGFDTSDQTVYEWGRDYRAGDQQGLVYRDIVFATYVHSVTLSRSLHRGWSRSLTLGDPRARESLARGYARSIKSVANAVSRVKTIVF